MNRPRDRASAAGLLPRMEARPWSDGKTVTYRYHPVAGKPINLGTDRGDAIRKVLELNGGQDESGTVGRLWRQYMDSPGLDIAEGAHTSRLHRLQRRRCSMCSATCMHR